jgi:(p)ppGpp synthase/HD superfamily hydrolase
MAKYHINPDTGVPGICRAKSSCPFGGVDDHYDSREQAITGYEKQMEGYSSKESSQQRTLKRMAAPELKEALALEMDLNGESFTQVINAVTLAEKLHQGQIRQEVVQGRHKTPYIEHPLRNTLRLVRLDVEDPNILVGAVLHDVVEDCSDKFSNAESEESQRRDLLDHIGTVFGKDSERIVEGVTSPPKPSDENKNTFYAKTVDREMKMGADVYLVKFSDFVDNAGSLRWMEVGSEDKARRLASKYHPTVKLFREGLERNHSEIKAKVGYRNIDKISRRLDTINQDLVEILKT